MLPKNTCGGNSKNLKAYILIENESTGKRKFRSKILELYKGFFAINNGNPVRTNGSFQIKTWKRKG